MRPNPQWLPSSLHAVAQGVGIPQIGLKVSLTVSLACSGGPW